MSFVVAALYGLAASSLVAPQQAPAPQKIWPGFGVNIAFKEPAQGEIELLRASGVDYVRSDLNWSQTEKSQGKYDFSEYDRLLGRLKQQRIRPIFVLAYGNDLYEKGAPSTEKAISAYADWAKAVVTHFKGEEIVYEIWNEPNRDIFWKPKANPLAYSKLAVRAARAMKEANPESRIIAPGVATVDTEYLRRAITPELLGLIDGVSVHPYRKSGPETVMKDYEKVRSLIRATAPAGRENLPIICSEWGYSTYRGGDVNEERQTMYLAKLWLLSATAGCPISIYYDWKDDGNDATNSAHRYGIIRTNLTVKPAFDAARLVTKAFRGCTVFRRMQKKDPLDWVILGAGDGRLVRASWYQKLGVMPKFEEYDMSDRSNRALYNRIIEEANRETTPPPTKPIEKPVKTPEPPINDTTVNREPNLTTTTKPPVSGPVNTSLMGQATLSFAPPIDEEGWCAIIDKPSNASAMKFEFRYDRKSSGAKVTCFASVTGTRTVEPLANMDDQTIISALLGTKKVGDFSVAKAPLAASDLEVNMANGRGFEASPVMLTEQGGAVTYQFAGSNLTCFVGPKQPMVLPDNAKKLVIWIKSDGTGNRLSARLADESGKSESIELGLLEASNDRNGWRAVVIPLTGTALVGKLHWEAILAIEASDKNQPKSGTIEFGPAAYEF